MRDAAGTTICRCEDLALDDLDRLVDEYRLASLEDLKRHSRVTMGPCQGRVCRGSLVRYWRRTREDGRVLDAVDHAANSVADLPLPGEGTVPGPRPPARPTTVGDIAALDIDQDAPWGDKDAP